MSKKLYVIIFLIIVAALGASYLLMPRQREMALMQLKDKHFDEARALYEKELAQGKLSIENVNQLTQLYLQSGEIDKAIDVMEKYIKINPNQLDARQKLGTLYQYAQRSDDYLRNLEEINRLNPQPENLKALSDIYNFNTQYDKQAETLKKLIEIEKGKDPQHFIDLANILASKHSYADAITTLRGLQKTHPDQFGFKEAQLLVSLLFDDKKPDEADKTATEWVQAHTKDVEGGAEMVNMVHFKGNSTMGNALIALFSEQQINDSPALLQEKILLLLADGKEDEAYTRLKTLYTADKLTPDLRERLLYLAASRGERTLTQDLLKKIDLTSLSEPQLLALVELALTQHDSELLAHITKALPADVYKDSYPLLMAALAVANHSGNMQTTIVKLDSLKLTSQQDLQMARICAHEQLYDCTSHMLEKLPDMKDLSDAEVASVGDLYLTMHQWKTGSDFIAKAQTTRKSLEIDAVAVKFAAASGDDAKVEAWLKAYGNNANTRQLNDLYFAALNNNHLSTAVSVAEFEHDKSDTAQSRSLLANAYVRSGQFEPALKLLRNNTDMSNDDQNNYLIALTKLSTYNPQYRKELSDYAAQKLHSHVSSEQKMALIYALVAAKQMDVAMPYVHELALSNGGQWASLYAETLDKQGKHAEARSFWITVARQPGTPVKQKRSIAYNLLEQGDRADAEAIFASLATNASAGSSETKQLLYIWGPRPQAEHMQWIDKRYSQASGQEQARWADIVSDTATSDYMIDFVNRHPDAMNNKKIATAYFEALVANGTFISKLGDYTTQAKESGDPTLLRSYAQVAEDNGFAHEASIAYDTVATLDPSDNIAVRQAGLTAYNQANYTSSRFYLGEYVDAYSKDVIADQFAYRAFFHYGELLRQKGQIKEAQEYYRDAIERIDTQELATPEALSVKAQSLVWTGNVDDGLKVFANASSMYPQDDNMRADLISTLIELKRYKQARKLLATPPNAAFDTASLAVNLPGTNSDVKDYTLLSNDTELLIHSTLPLGTPGAVSSAAFKDIPWVSAINEGYDSILITAQPGYKFQIATDTGTPSVMAVTDNSSTAQKAAKQTVLRYELLSSRIDLETGHVYEAATRMNGLMPEYKNDPQLLGFTANAENYGGNWPQAEQLLTTARQLAPENEDLARLDKDARRMHAENITASYDWLKRGSDHEEISTLSGYVDASKHLQAGGSITNDHAEVRNGRMVDGRVGSFTGDRQFGELYARYYDENGKRVQASLFANNDTLGAGGYYSFLNPLGQTDLTAEWHKPYLEYTVGVLEDATRDRLSFLHTIKPDPRLTISAGPAVNRYNTSEKDNVISTAGGQLEVVYRLIDEQPYLALGYGLDAEYTLSHKKGFDATGDYTRLFPLVSHEIHFFSVNTGYSFDANTYGDLLVGYGFDRLGGNGPTIEGKLTHEFNSQFDAQIRALYGLDNSNTKNNMTRLGGYIRWRF